MPRSRRPPGSRASVPRKLPGLLPHGLPPRCKARQPGPRCAEPRSSSSAAAARAKRNRSPALVCISRPDPSPPSRTRDSPATPPALPSNPAIDPRSPIVPRPGFGPGFRRAAQGIAHQRTPSSIGGPHQTRFLRCITAVTQCGRQETNAHPLPSSPISAPPSIGSKSQGSPRMATVSGMRGRIPLLHPKTAKAMLPRHAGLSPHSPPRQYASRSNEGALGAPTLPLITNARRPAHRLSKRSILVRTTFRSTIGLAR
jgi:hypothetical protein